MRNFDKIFDRGKRNYFDKKDSKKRSFEKGRFGNKERPQMYEAICSECGKRCEVPFKPTGEKPVFCSQCYSNREGGEPRKGRENSFREKRMFSAICEKCGKRFELPFRPIEGRAVYCDDCFEGNNNKVDSKSFDQYKKQLDSLNEKLDKIINILTLISSSVTPEEKKPKNKAD